MYLLNALTLPFSYITKIIYFVSKINKLLIIYYLLHIFLTFISSTFPFICLILIYLQRVKIIKVNNINKQVLGKTMSDDAEAAQSTTTMLFWF